MLADLQARFLESIGRADPDAPVPSCGQWRVRDLVVHLASVHHWAAAQARRRDPTPLTPNPSDLASFYDAQAGELRATLAELDPGSLAWTLDDDGVPPQQQRGTVAFWHRRQVHETLVHLWDLETALEQNGPEVEASWWVDCLDEVVTVMAPRQVRLRRTDPPSARLVFVPDETGAPVSLTSVASDAVDVRVSGPARTLALLAWGRVGLDDPAVTVCGDRGAAGATLAEGLTP